MNRQQVTQAVKRAAVFLKPSHSQKLERAKARAHAAQLLRAAIEEAVRAGDDGLALRVLELAQEAEHDQ